MTNKQIAANLDIIRDRYRKYLSPEEEQALIDAANIVREAMPENK